MKKTIAILLVMAVVMTGVFADNVTELTLKSTVDASELEYGLFNGEGEAKVLYDNLNLTDPNKNKSVTIKVKAVNGKVGAAEKDIDINVTCSDGFVNQTDFSKTPLTVDVPDTVATTAVPPLTVISSPDEYFDVAEFVLSWVPDPNLAAGDYVADVVISYTATV